MANIVVDCHCHLTVDASSINVNALRSKLLQEYSDHEFWLMTTYWNDCDLVKSHLLDCPNIIPFFGIHPWYSHLYSVSDEPISKEQHYMKVLSPSPPASLIAALPEPKRLSEQIIEWKSIIDSFEGKRKFGIGEIGLDKVFRVPYGILGYTDKANSNCYVSMDHQVAIFKQMLQLAQEYHIPVSVHCVRAHGRLFDETISITRAKPKSNRERKREQQMGTSDNAPKKVEIPIILHSWSGSVDQVKMWCKYPGIFFSVSNWINGQKSLEWAEAVQAITESDFGLDNWLLNKSSDYDKNMEEIREKLQKVGVSSAQCQINMKRVWAEQL
ncbi:hypothetical protein DIURU_003383 [Diutina rugosa]|uniref:Uncharacterized protein n=1 Tax=Diutina rugosa TaxID=5481 RepID=A0A642UL25_DIURU|nr:uncharacterized protein DIURU_003383 [Diutina rugosa]KAA8901013.1 hypothetical protein DIURU_003383 [Diutina rugosa]